MAVLHNFQHTLAVTGAENTVGGIHKAVIHQRADNNQLRQHQHYRTHQIRGVQIIQSVIYRTHKNAHYQTDQREVRHAAAEIVIMPVRAVGKADSGQKFQTSYKITHHITCLNDYTHPSLPAAQQ